MMLNTNAPWKDFLVCKLTRMAEFRQDRDVWVDNFDQVIDDVEKLNEETLRK